METLYAIGMLVGLMRGPAPPPKPIIAPPVEQHQIAQQHQVVAEPPRSRRKSDWPLNF
jgi:hypothetical protein